MRACAAEAGEKSRPRAAAPGAAPDREYGRSSLLMAIAIIATIPSVTPPRKVASIKVHYRCCAATHDSFPTTCLGAGTVGPCLPGRRRGTPRTPSAKGFIRGKAHKQRISFDQLGWQGLPV